MNLKDYCKAGHLVVMNNGLRCLLIPNREGLQLVALGSECKESLGFFDTAGKDYIWIASLQDYDEELKSALFSGLPVRRIDKIYGLAFCGRFWKEDKNRTLLWQRSETE